MRQYRTTIVCDTGVNGTKWRGGQIWALSASSLTVRLHLEHSYIGDRTVARSMYPGGVVGDAVAVCVAGNNPTDYAITSIAPARFADPSGSNDSVRRYEFNPGHIDPSLSGDEGFVPWSAGLNRDRSRYY